MLDARLPNLLIAGVPKAGTTSLHTYLSQHPEVCGSYTKELAFFSPLFSGQEVPQNADYLRHFKHCRGERFILESTPTYLYGGKELIEEICNRLGPDVRIVFILRDPVGRLISAYRHHTTKMRIPATTTWAEFIDTEPSPDRVNPAGYLAQGAYARFLPDWFEAFGDRLLILFFEDLESSARDVVKVLCDWLGIDFDFYRSSDFPVENRTVGYRNAYLHGAAMWLNIQTETFWRKHVRMKRLVRDFYYSLNEQERPMTPDQSIIDELERTYAGPNEELYDLLRKQGIQRLPAWLTDRVEPKARRDGGRA